MPNALVLPLHNQIGKTVLSRPPHLNVGRTTGGIRSCQLEGCRGLQIRVIWPDGSWTWPCSEGLGQTPTGDFQIL